MEFSDAEHLGSEKPDETAATESQVHVRAVLVAGIRALAAQPPLCQLVCVLYYFCGWPQARIADQLGRNDSLVNGMLARGCKAVLDAMADAA